MGSRDRETRYDSLPSSARFTLRQWAKDLRTCAPGHIHAYDAASRRATVQPALDLVTTDNRRITAPLIANVPVVWPSAGGWILTAPLAAGDPVLLVWSQRGLTGFKREHGRALPDADRLMSLADAIAIPGFGPTDVTPASSSGIALQSHDGTISIALEADAIRIRTPGAVDIRADTLTINGQRVRHDGDGAYD